MRRYHDDFAWAFAAALRDQGQRVATEVGVPRGRIDVLAIDEEGQWVELFEVKVRVPEDGIAQLHRYARAAGVEHVKLTLVVPPTLLSAALVATARASGVSVRTFDGFVQMPLWWRGTWIHFPFHWRGAEAGVAA